MKHKNRIPSAVMAALLFALVVFSFQGCFSSDSSGESSLKPVEIQGRTIKAGKGDVRLQTQQGQYRLTGKLTRMIEHFYLNRNLRLAGVEEEKPHPKSPGIFLVKEIILEMDR